MSRNHENVQIRTELYIWLGGGAYRGQLAQKGRTLWNKIRTLITRTPSQLGHHERWLTMSQEGDITIHQVYQ